MRIPFTDLHHQLEQVLLREGFSPERANLSARLFAENSLDGVYSHGLNRFPTFVKYIRQGLVDVQATPVREGQLGGLERWDGRQGPGNLNAHASMARALELAATHGVGCVALRNTNHWMRGGTYGWQAADAGCLAICMTNTLPNLPPWGALDARTGNNPLVLAVPRAGGRHVVLDMAMSQYSFGKLQSYQLKEEDLPLPGGYDQQGNLTVDPKAIQETNRALPIGYWKGSGLAILIDLFVSVLSGGRSTARIGELGSEYGVSQLFVCLDLRQLQEGEVAARAADEVINFVHGATAVQEGGRVYYPGERTLETRQENTEQGIPVDPKIWQQVQAL